jgi:uncharacterized protein
MSTSDERAVAENVARARSMIERFGTEYKSLDGAILTSDDNTATVCFSVFGVRDLHGDVVQPGAFTKTIDERGPILPLLWNHDLNLAAIGVTRALHEAPKADLPQRVREKFPEATGAMLADVEFFDTPRAQEIHAGLKKGAPYQASYAYNATKKSLTTLPDGQKARVLEEIRLLELTVCHFGANPATYLSKAAGLLAEYEAKAGRRHSAADQDWLDQIAPHLNEIAALVLRLGASNIQLLSEATADRAAPSVTTRTRTPDGETLLGSIASILGRT